MTAYEEILLKRIAALEAAECRSEPRPDCGFVREQEQRIAVAEARVKALESPCDNPCLAAGCCPRWHAVEKPMTTPEEAELVALRTFAGSVTEVAESEDWGPINGWTPIAEAIAALAVARDAIGDSFEERVSRQAESVALVDGQRERIEALEDGIRQWATPARANGDTSERRLCALLPAPPVQCSCDLECPGKSECPLPAPPDASLGAEGKERCPLCGAAMTRNGTYRDCQCGFRSS